MTQVLAVATGAVGLIIFVSFIASRLIRARTAGLSVRMQMFIALALIVGAFAFGLGVVVLDRVKARADLLGHGAALGEARTVAALVSAEMEAGGSSLREVAERLQNARALADSELHVKLMDAQGALVFGTGRASKEAGTVSASVPIFIGSELVGHTQVVKPTLLIEQTLADFAPSVLLISLLLGTVAAAAAAVIGRTIARPIEALTRFAEQISEGDRRAPLPRGHGREVMRLSRALDSMRRELQGRPFVETFAADLSHELKNPVAAIRASAEVLRDGALEEPVEAARFVARILESSARIEALLGDLLSLARLEARGVSQAASVNFSEEARLSVATAQRAGAEVSLDLREATSVRGDRAWLSRALGNLLENAQLHGDGAIGVAVWREGDRVICEVENAGHIPRAVQKRIFGRFVTTRADRGGTGLGLAITRAVAEAHGGRATCQNYGPPQVTFRMVLPVA